MSSRHKERLKLMKLGSLYDFLAIEDAVRIDDSSGDNKGKMF